MVVSKPSVRTNNFDVIRLCAAIQVVILHAVAHLGLNQSSRIIGVAVWIVSFFPGVPIFFFVSGFLISKSWESSASPWDYARNRALRIYPALIVCTIVSVAMVFIVGYLPRPGGTVLRMGTWMLAQMTVVQFYNPVFMRDFGAGVLNGSLWTITVELQFYVLVPLIYFLCGLERRRGTLLLALFMALFLVANVLYWRAEPESNPTFALKLLGVSFVPWVYMFLVGILVQRHFARVHSMLSGRVLWLAASYILASALARRLAGWPTANDINPVLFAALCSVIFSAAFTLPSLAQNVLRGNDISYGMYIYHMPCVDALIYLGWLGHGSALALTTVLTGCLAVISWRLVERPCLALKRSGIRHNVVRDESAPRAGTDCVYTA